MGEFYLKPLFTAAVFLHCGRARSEMLSNLFVGCVSTTPCGNFELQITVTDIGILHPAHFLYQGFSVTGYIRTGTGVKQTEVDCELTARWRFN